MEGPACRSSLNLPKTKQCPAPTLLPLKPPSATYTACYHHSDPQLSRLVTATLVHPSHCHLQFLGLFHLSYCSLQSSSPLSQCQRRPDPANQLVLTTHWCPLKSLKRKHSPYMGWYSFSPHLLLMPIWYVSTPRPGPSLRSLWQRTLDGGGGRWAGWGSNLPGLSPTGSQGSQKDPSSCPGPRL